MRQSGYYWVRAYTGLEIGYYDGISKNWYIIGRSNQYTDIDFKEIDERRITRE